jgi:hypothetical protein
LGYLLYAINLGDGCKTDKINWKRHTYTIITGNYIFAENLQQLCILNGTRCNISSRVDPISQKISWLIYIEYNKSSKSLNFAKNDKRNKFSKEDTCIDENVWCISNKWETIITRRNGKVAILGNCIGRGTRLKSADFVQRNGSDVCIVLDFVDNTGRLSLINAYELERGKPIEERIFLPKESKEKLLEEQRQRRERYIKLGYGKDRKIDLLKLPQVKVYDSEKMLEPATEKQLDWLKRVGVWKEDVEYTKKQASELISNLPCYESQIRYLAIKGYDVTYGATIGQFQRVKQAIDMKEKFIMGDKEKAQILNNLKK